MKKLIFFIFATAPFVGATQNSNGVFKNLDSALRYPSHAESLRLDSDDIVEISPRIVELTNLRNIVLSDNPRINLVGLFDKLSMLPKLEFLNLSNCQIESLPANISKLSHLKRLMIGNNKLTALPPEIREMKNLREVIFSQYPEDFRRLSEEQKLQMLSLLPHAKILLTEYFGGEHGHARLGKVTVKVTPKNLWPNR
jgi:Leucine-rich repeat (LRR) protein